MICVDFDQHETSLKIAMLQPGLKNMTFRSLGRQARLNNFGWGTVDIGVGVVGKIARPLLPDLYTGVESHVDKCNRVANAMLHSMKQIALFQD